MSDVARLVDVDAQEQLHARQGLVGVDGGPPRPAQSDPARAPRRSPSPSERPAPRYRAYGPLRGKYESRAVGAKTHAIITSSARTPSPAARAAPAQPGPPPRDRSQLSTSAIFVFASLFT